MAVRGPRGLGKTALAAWVILWYAVTRDGLDWKIPTTAGAWVQLSKFLWPEIHKWARALKWEELGLRAPSTRTSLMRLSMKLKTGEAFAITSDQPELVEGAHADCLLYVFDESKAIPPATWNSVEGAFSNAGANGREAYALAISTPGEPQGKFYDIHSRKPGTEHWKVRHVTLDECLAAGQISKQWVEERRKDWGETSALFHNHVLGEFWQHDTDSIIPLSWVEAAVNRWYALQDAPDGFESPGVTALGIDIGMESDKSIAALRQGNYVSECVRLPRGDTMATTGRIKVMLDRFKKPAVIDVIGIGAGVVHRLQEMGYDQYVIPFTANERTDFLDRSGLIGFVNKRAAIWWNMRELLDPASGEDIALPPDDELIGDLTAPRSRQVSGGKIMVESKGDIRVRLGRSTDAGDAVLMSFWADSEAGEPVAVW